MKLRLLFVCSGNICRSPMAESIMRHKVAAIGLADQIEVDGAGIGSWHEGERADRRTVQTLSRHGIPEPSRARQMRSDDFENFDYIFAMDESHLEDLLRWPGARPEKVSMFQSWNDRAQNHEVHDPYYGHTDGFEEMFEMIDQTSDAILAKLIRQIESS